MRLACLAAVLACSCSESTSSMSPADVGSPLSDSAFTVSDAQPISDAGSADAANADAQAIAPDAAAPGSDAALPADAAMPPDAATPVSHCAEMPVGRVSLPADDSGHSEAMEWWYWTGHLHTADGRWFGFEEVFFGTLVLGQPGRMAHVAVTDIQGDKFHYAAQLHLGALGAIPNGFDFTMAPQTAKGGNGHDVLHGEADGWTLDLTLDATKAPVFQHEVGYTDYPFGGYTYYYSRERMDAMGTLKNGAETLAVTGTGWFDHQWGDITHALNKGWDWFAIELDDGREMMLFVVRDSGQQVLVGGSSTDTYCVTTPIAADAFQVTALGSWKSPRTNCTYPAGWEVKVNGETFTVTPAIGDQEVSTAVPIYWEGASLVTGAATGRAYVELTGYCP